jgi:hypothetical protein
MVPIQSVTEVPWFCASDDASAMEYRIFFDATPGGIVMRAVYGEDHGAKATHADRAANFS